MKRRRRLFPVLVLVVLVLAAGVLLVPPVRWAVVGWLLGWPSLDIPKIAFAEPGPGWPQYVIDQETRRVIKRSGPSQAGWSTTLDGYVGGVRPPHVVWDADRVYVSHGDGVTALDAQTEKLLWHSPGPQNRLCLSKKLLLAVGRDNSEANDTHGSRLLARSVETGEKVFEVPLEKIADPEELRPLADLFLVQDLEHPGGEDKTLLIDRQGQVRHRLDRQVVDGIQQEDDYVLLTSKDVVCLTKDGPARWSTAFPQHIWIAGGGLIQLDNGDLLAFLHGRIADSGVQLMRLNTRTGTLIWQAHCHGLGISHSAYNHRAQVEVIDGKYIKVISMATGGRFAELLDLQSGSRLRRKVPENESLGRWLDWLSRWLP